MAEAAASLRSNLVIRPRSVGRLPFSVAAASTAVGRAVALHVLFSTSMSQVRRRLLRFLWRLRSGVVPAVSLLRPRGAPGTVAVAALLAVVIRRVADVRSRARSEYRRRFWRDMMRCALTYEDWAHAARMLEKETPRAGESGLYDEELVRSKLQELRQRRREGSLRDMVFYLRTDLLRNLGNMCNPKLHNGRLQVPKLIKDYIDEVSGQLKMICESNSEELNLEDKLAFVHETRHAFGRTALLLSGGATMTAFHLGVVKVLVDNKLLPRIIGGSSAGSIICAIIASRSRTEIESFFAEDMKNVKFFDQMGGVFAVMQRVLHKGAIHEIRQLQRLMMDMTSNMTFQEAYDRTGRVLGVTVCSPRPHEPPRCLNYLTSPNVLIWSAVTASCAFPGLFEAQELMAKDRFGNIVPYHAPFSGASDKVAPATSSRRWRDGTLESDLPMMQLKELFNVNHFIVSQANPHISPWLRVKEIARSYGGDFSGKLANLVEMEVKHRFSQLLELGLPLGGFAKLFTQDWEGDITVVMPATLAQYSKIIVNPSFLDLKMALNQGSRCTWEKVSAIKATCAIEFALDESAILLNHMRRLKNSTERTAQASESTPTAKPGIHRRIPSWNYVARENKPNCIEEDVLADSGHRVPLPSPRVCNSPHCRAEEGAAADEAENELNSWTRCGGPLMRTASAKRFANFVQSLDIAAVKASQRASFFFDGAESQKHDNNTTPPTSSPIIFSDGDLLQPEKVGNGFVLNVVKKKEYILTPKAGNPEERHVPYPEAAAECCGSSSGSECSDDDEAQLNCADAMVSHCDIGKGFDRSPADEARVLCAGQ